MEEFAILVLNIWNDITVVLKPKAILFILQLFIKLFIFSTILLRQLIFSSTVSVQTSNILLKCY